MKHTGLFALIILIFFMRTSAQEISPYLFGQNHWMATGDEGSRIGFLDLLWPKVKASGIKMVRIGGIGYEDRFPNDQKLTDMIDSIHGAGAEPLVQIPRHMSNQEVTRVIKKFKYSGGKGIRFYSIGNEPICNKLEKFGDVYEYLTRLCPVMKAADPKIKILVFDACTFYEEEYAALCGGRLDLTGKDKNGNWMIDGFTFHNYPNGPDFERHNVIFSGPKSIERQAQLLVEMMKAANKKHGRTGNSELVWGLTETNVTYANPNREISGFGNPSFLGGQFIAEVYGIGMKYGAFTVDPWSINEADRISSDFGYIGLPSEFYPRSSYYHTQMMAENMKGEFLPTESSNSYVKTIASMSGSEICIMILNEDQYNDYDFDLILNENSKSKKSLVISADLGLDKSISGSIPNQTTMLFVLSRSGEVLKQYTYGLKHNLKYQKPEIK